jgi:phospholipase/carboxylesterase
MDRQASAQADLGFIHRFVPGESPGRTPLLLLHGTGGDESDLIPLGLQLLPEAALLSPRGKTSEHGMPRFFRRIAEGVFDVEDLKARTQELAEFVSRARKAYGIEKPIAVGFSNGANIAWSLLFGQPETLAGAILLRATLPFEPNDVAKLDDVPVLMINGSDDPIVPAESRDRLANALRSAGAALQYELLPAGHMLTREDVVIAKSWLSQR